MKFYPFDGKFSGIHFLNRSVIEIKSCFKLEVKVKNQLLMQSKEITFYDIIIIHLMDEFDRVSNHQIASTKTEKFSFA